MKRRYARGGLATLGALAAPLVLGSFVWLGEGCTLALGDGDFFVTDAGSVADGKRPVDGALPDAAPDATTPADAGTDAAGDAGSETGPGDGGDGGACQAGAQRCVGSSVETCGAVGQWSSPAACATGTCAMGNCSGTTIAGTSCTTGAGRTDCGGGAGESCCTSLEVPGGTYARTYAADGGAQADPATLSGFRLDKYPVTVGRFRAFVAAWNAGPGKPAAGAGKHAHLNGGKGLVDVGTKGGFEPGWVAADTATVSVTDANLTTCGSESTWTSAAGSQERLPMNCVTWQSAYAFCIWDGGFLPSEAEWEMAAAGGGQQREYPWGSADPGSNNAYAIYNCDYPTPGAACAATGTSNVAPVGTAPMGAGRWGQLDLAGELAQWVLDWDTTYVDPCVDCANVSGGTIRGLRGGVFKFGVINLVSSQRYGFTPTMPSINFGFRCARTP